MRRRRPSFQSLVAIAFGFIALFLIVGDSGKSPAKIASSEQWVTQAGAGLIAPACGSSGTYAPTCVNSSTVQVTYTWSWDPIAHPGCQNASIFINGANTGLWLTCNDSYTFTLTPNQTYTFQVQFFGYGASFIDSTSFTTTMPNCAPAPPTINDVTINSTNVVANGSNQYNITSYASDARGGDHITFEQAFINLQDASGNYPTSANYRGYMAWYIGSGDIWPPADAKGPSIACSGGGVAQMYGGYGSEYTNLISCSTSIVGAQRIVNYVVSFNSNFTTPGTGNILSGLAVNDGPAGSNIDGWHPFKTFNLGSIPTIDSVTISSPTVVANGTNPYTITTKASDVDGGNYVGTTLALVDFIYLDQVTARPPSENRGLFGWSTSASGTWGAAATTPIACTGGGYGQLYGVNPANGLQYGYDYTNLVSCSTSVSGNQRTANWVVNFKSNFVAPTTGNTLSGYAYNIFGSGAPAWKTFVGFDLGSNLPDLTTGGVTPTTATAGTAVTLSATVTNGGGSSTGTGFTDLFQRATDASGTGSTDIGTFASAALAASGSGAATLSYTFPSAGTWYVRVCADKSSSANTGVITESNEANNCGTWTAVTVAAAAAVPVATLTATPSTIDVGQSSVLAWSATNATSCVGTGFTAGAASGSVSTGVMNTAGTYNYQVVCSGPGGSSAPAFATLIVNAPTATISASPAHGVVGSSSTITWSATGVLSCTVTGPSGTVASGSADASGNFSGQLPGQIVTSSQKTFTISCTSTGGQTVAQSVILSKTGFEEF